MYVSTGCQVLDIWDSLAGSFMSNVPNNLMIRRALADDALLLSVLGTVTFYEAYFEQDDPTDLAHYLIESFSPSEILEQLDDENSIFLIAFYHGKAVGYARLVSGAPHQDVSSKNAIELRRLYVLEHLWRKGVGEKLLSECEAIARQIGKQSVWLGVWQQNERGQRFYTKHSYKKVGTITFPYFNSVGINDVMEKKL